MRRNPCELRVSNSRRMIDFVKWMEEKRAQFASDYILKPKNQLRRRTISGVNLRASQMVLPD